MAANGNAPAYEFLRAVFDAADVADDVLDEGATSERISQVLTILTALPANEFYRKHEEAMRAIMLSAVVCWDVSNEIKNKHYAAELPMIVFYTAMMCGGYKHARSVTLEWANASEV